MRIVLISVFLVSLILLFSGCGGGGGGTPTPSDNNPPPPPYNIYGYVKDTAGRILPGASVSACYKDDPQTILDSKTTDSEGKYYLWVPWSSPNKVYLLTASKSEYQSSTKEVILSSPDSPQEVDFFLNKE
ncbi:carboxypeptidase regulatory-like domain-containing protein [bacterium]|nr:carboxypeptidase regulatory-like domain-containing protein [bacterium]